MLIQIWKPWVRTFFDGGYFSYGSAYHPGDRIPSVRHWKSRTHQPPFVPRRFSAHFESGKKACARTSISLQKSDRSRAMSVFRFHHHFRNVLIQKRSLMPDTICYSFIPSLFYPLPKSSLRSSSIKSST